LTGSFEGEVFLNGRYSLVRYEYFSYPKDARNKRENVSHVLLSSLTLSSHADSP
jgi:hypothetical protein